MSIADLKAELKSKGMSTLGKKAELIARLKETSAEFKGPLKEMTLKQTPNSPGDAVKKEEPVAVAEVEESDFSKGVCTLTTTKKKRVVSRQRQMDCHYHLNIGGVEVVDDWDCLLNQTNIGQNNNKFYVIQLLRDSSR